MNTIIENPKTRESLYHVIAAALVVAAVWGLIEADTAEEITKAVAPIFGAGAVELAAANTPKKGEASREPDYDLEDEYDAE